MSFFDFVEQNHRKGATTDGLGELPPLVVAHIARRGTNQARNGVLLHVLGHVDTHHRLFGVEQVGGEGLGQLGFTDPSGSKENEAGNGTVGVSQSGAGALNRIGHGGHGLVLAHHSLMKFVLQQQELLHFRLHQFAHRNARPFRDNFGNVCLNHLLTGEGAARFLHLRHFMLGSFQLTLQFR